MPLTLLALVALAPLVYVALTFRRPVDASSSRRAAQLAFVIAATAWIFQLWLVGAAAPLARSVAAGAPLSQLRAICAGARGLVRGAVPHLCMLAAVLIGLGALVVPGLVALTLFCLAAASEHRGLHGSLTESADIVRRHARLVVTVLVALVVVGVGIAVVAKLTMIGPLPKQPVPRGIATYRNLVQLIVAGAVLVAPIGASLLAGVHARHSRPRP